MDNSVGLSHRESLVQLLRDLPPGYPLEKPLLVWTDRLLDADRVEDVFADR